MWKVGGVLAKKKMTTTFDEKLIADLKIRAIQMNVNVNDILEYLIRQFLDGKIIIESNVGKK